MNVPSQIYLKRKYPCDVDSHRLGIRSVGPGLEKSDTHPTLDYPQGQWRSLGAKLHGSQWPSTNKYTERRIYTVNFDVRVPIVTNFLGDMGSGEHSRSDAFSARCESNYQGDSSLVRESLKDETSITVLLSEKFLRRPRSAFKKQKQKSTRPWTCRRETRLELL